MTREQLIRAAHSTPARWRRNRSVVDLVGDTPVLWIPSMGDHSTGFWAKLEGMNPGGMKDRAALHMVRRARERGDMFPGATIVESTSGTLGAGLALAGMALGHPVHLVADRELEPAMRQALVAHGAVIDIVDTPHPSGGWQQARLDRVAELLAESGNAWWPDQQNNPDNSDSYASLAEELDRDLGRIDVLVCSVGTGGHSSGIAAGLRSRNRDLELIGVDSVGSRIFGQPARSRLMRGLGSSIHPRNVVYDMFDEVHWVAASEAAWVCRQLAKMRYVSGGWSVGSVALVASWVAQERGGGARVVAVFPDGHARYLSTIYDDDYCRAHKLLSLPPASRPDEIGHPLEREVHRWTRCLTVVDPRAAGAVETVMSPT
jgi:cysteine synthase